MKAVLDTNMVLGIAKAKPLVFDPDKAFEWLQENYRKEIYVAISAAYEVFRAKNERLNALLVSGAIRIPNFESYGLDTSTLDKSISLIFSNYEYREKFIESLKRASHAAIAQFFEKFFNAIGAFVILSSGMTYEKRYGDDAFLVENVYIAMEGVHGISAEVITEVYELYFDPDDASRRKELNKTVDNFLLAACTICKMMENATKNRVKLPEHIRAQPLTNSISKEELKTEHIRAQPLTNSISKEELKTVRRRIRFHFDEIEKLLIDRFESPEYLYSYKYYLRLAKRYLLDGITLKVNDVIDSGTLMHLEQFHVYTTDQEILDFLKHERPDQWRNNQVISAMAK